MYQTGRHKNSAVQEVWSATDLLPEQKIYIQNILVRTRPADRGKALQHKAVVTLHFQLWNGIIK
jgi:hypothetical protein